MWLQASSTPPLARDVLGPGHLEALAEQPGTPTLAVTMIGG